MKLSKTDPAVAGLPEESLSMDDYPTEEELQKIRSYKLEPGWKDKLESFLEFLEGVWHWPDWGFIRGEGFLELHTGGWSGNEDIICALQETAFWIMCWESSRRGGHYLFKLPIEKNK